MYYKNNLSGGSIDYNSGPYTVNFPIGSTNSSFDIMVYNDNVFEDNETFNVSINSITNGHVVGTPGVVAVTIIDTTSKLFRNCLAIYVATQVNYTLK